MATTPRAYATALRYGTTVWKSDVTSTNDPAGLFGPPDGTYATFRTTTSAGRRFQADLIGLEPQIPAQAPDATVTVAAYITAHASAVAPWGTRIVDLFNTVDYTQYGQKTLSLTTGAGTTSTYTWTGVPRAMVDKLCLRIDCTSTTTGTSVLSIDAAGLEASYTAVAHPEFSGGGTLDVQTAAWESAAQGWATLTGVGRLLVWAGLSERVVEAGYGSAYGVVYGDTGPAASVFEGTAALSGSGALTAATSARASRATAGSGAGALAASTRVSIARVAAFSGVGAAGGTRRVSASGSGVFTGVGQPSAAQQRATAATAAAFTAAGTFAAVRAPRFTSPALFAGSGQTAVSVAQAVAATAGFTGSGQVAATTGARWSAGASFTGSGAASAEVSFAAFKTVGVSGSGVAAAGSAARPSVTADAAGAGEAQASPAKVTAVAAPQLTGAGQAAAQGTASTAGGSSPQFTAAGSLTATAHPAAATAKGFSGSGAAAIAGQMRRSATAAVAGSGSATASAGDPRVAATRALTGSGSLTAQGAGSQSGSAGAATSGSGQASAIGSARTFAVAAFTGAGSVATGHTAGVKGQAVFAGSGAASAGGGRAETAAATFTGAGALATTSTVHAGQRPQLTGGSDVDVSGVHTLKPSIAVTLTGTGAAYADPGAATVFTRPAFYGESTIGAALVAGTSGTALFAGAGGCAVATFTTTGWRDLRVNRVGPAAPDATATSAVDTRRVAVQDAAGRRVAVMEVSR